VELPADRSILRLAATTAYPSAYRTIAPPCTQGATGLVMRVVIRDASGHESQDARAARVVDAVARPAISELRATPAVVNPTTAAIRARRGQNCQTGAHVERLSPTEIEPRAGAFGEVTTRSPSGRS